MFSPKCSKLSTDHKKENLITNEQQLPFDAYIVVIIIKHIILFTIIVANFQLFITKSI